MQTTEDAFLGGRLVVEQPARGYRAGIDPVLMAAAVPARAGDSVLELGCGVGVASLALGIRVPGLALAALELQPELAALARANAARNEVALEVVEGDVAQMPAALKARRFAHVMLNPPWFPRTASVRAADPAREAGLGETAPLEVWLAAAAKRLVPRGTLTLVHRAERLPEILAAAPRALGSVELLPLLPREGRAPRLILLRARAGGRAPFRLHAGLVLHEGAAHPGDREHFSERVRAVLREGAPLDFSA
ncbi:methyltransferase [Rhodosalinus halophilus]|uniref:Methyltransferase n=1 Tax=Rhodosalinus halophilus TaxID=2259333 RepID=A0A365UC37_9RHOB|nr:methyltransferase [Rhodosalinus halophilus]RBI86198.1 methyltransferase [Rhodosalinus halophilus]